MAGSQISTSVTIINSLLGFQAISLTDFNATTLSSIAAGSKVEIAGAFFTFNTDEAINASSWSAITPTGTNAYIHLTPSGSAGTQIVSAAWSTTKPVWSDSKQGWYASAGSNTRVIGGALKGTSATNQYKKYLYNGWDLSYIIRSATYGSIAIGYGALENEESDFETLSGNIAIGYGGDDHGPPLADNVGGLFNIAIGEGALNKNTEADYNIAIGRWALTENISGTLNIALGNSALQTATAASNCIAIGRVALAFVSGAGSLYDIGIGDGALENITSGINNVGIGRAAGNDITTADNNTCIGSNSGEKIITGSANTAIGKSAGATNVSGANNTFLGNGADNTATNLSNIITLGNSAITTLRCAASTISVISDARDKADINDLQLGLDFVNDLHPCEYKWDMRAWYDGKKDGSKKANIKSFGFIAQEVDEVQKKYDAEYLALVFKDDPEHLEVDRGGKIIPILVKAIQELAKEVEELKKQIRK